MKFYSEVTKKLYDSVKDLSVAEAEVKKAEAAKLMEETKKKEQRAARAKEVENALKAANEAQTKAIKLLKDFTKDYGYFHTSYSTSDASDAELPKIDFFDVLTNFLK